MALGGINSLWDIPGLERIQKVCSVHKVHFTAYGGLVRHLLLKLIETSQTGDKWDLFDLVPFSSDIDLIHTGTAEQTELLQRSLAYEIPFGECFRWQLRSVHDNAIYWDSMKVNNVVPASLMTLSSNSTNGIYDRWDGYRDYSSSKFRYIRNGFYPESPLFRAGRDLELFSALLYYRVLFEAGVALDEIENQPGLADARAVVVDSCAGRDTFTRLEESAYLRARLRYLSAALSAAARPGYLSESSDLIALTDLINYLEGYLGIEQILFPNDTLTVSAHLQGDSFRLPFNTANWLDGEAAVSAFDRALGGLSINGKPPSLGPGQVILFSSPMHYFELGISSSSHAGDEWSHEFVHFALRLDAAKTASVKPFLPDGLAVMVALCVAANAPEGEQTSEQQAEAGSARTILLPLPAVFHISETGLGAEDRRLFIRANCGGLFEATLALESELGGEIEVQFFVAGWKGLK